jgi:hypothetical protein
MLTGNNRDGDQRYTRQAPAWQSGRWPELTNDQHDAHKCQRQRQHEACASKQDIHSIVQRRCDESFGR